jgi:hypothetical protein
MIFRPYDGSTRDGIKDLPVSITINVRVASRDQNIWGALDYQEPIS